MNERQFLRGLARRAAAISLRQKTAADKDQLPTEERLRRGILGQFHRLPYYMRRHTFFPEDVGKFVAPEVAYFLTDRLLVTPKKLPEPVLKEMYRMGFTHPDAWKDADSAREYNRRLIGLMDLKPIEIFYPKNLAPLLPDVAMLPGFPGFPAASIPLPLKSLAEQAWKNEMERIYRDYQWNQGVPGYNVDKLRQLQKHLEGFGLRSYRTGHSAESTGEPPLPIFRYSEEEQPAQPAVPVVPPPAPAGPQPAPAAPPPHIEKLRKLLQQIKPEQKAAPADGSGRGKID